MKKIIKQIPFTQQVYKIFAERQYKHRFATNGYGCFWGVFETFEQAIQAAPKTKSIGYDNAELAQEYQNMLESCNWENTRRTIAAYDYPILFWLGSLLNQGISKIFDFGGNVGIHFYSYEKYLQYPENLQWMVCDVPEISKVGKQLADKRSAHNLLFTSNFNDVINKDIFLASGSVQYVENLADKISQANKPKYLLINRLPLYNGKEFVTLQNGGKVFYPQYVFNKTKFIEGITDIGYQLIDIWNSKDDACVIPFHSKNSVPFYSGLYFQLKA